MSDDMLEVLDESAIAAENSQVEELLTSLGKMQGDDDEPEAKRRKVDMPVPVLSRGNLEGHATFRGRMGTAGGNRE